MPGSPQWVRACLGLGGNQGDRLAHLRQALVELEEDPRLRILSCSPVFESEFVGPGKQEPYLNACVLIRTTLAAGGLLEFLKELESRHGRTPDSHLQPRPLDLDILLYSNEVRSDADLSLPHPRLRERAFVLEPLYRIVPQEEFPDSGETVADACAKIRQKSGPWVKELPGIVLWPESTGKPGQRL